MKYVFMGNKGESFCPLEIQSVLLSFNNDIIFVEIFANLPCIYFDSFSIVSLTPGCLMILAWVLFTGIGIIIARFYKNDWADKTFFGLKIWFQVS